MRAAGHTTTERSATNGTIVSAPTSVSFCTTHSGRSPLTGAKSTVIAGSPRATNVISPAGSSGSAEPRCAPPARAIGDRERITETDPEHRRGGVDRDPRGRDARDRPRRRADRRRLSRAARQGSLERGADLREEARVGGCNVFSPLFRELTKQVFLFMRQVASAFRRSHARAHRRGSDLLGAARLDPEA